MTAKKQFFILLFFFLTPILLGYIIYFTNPGLFSEKTVNYGELLEPIIATKEGDIEFTNDDSLKNIWSLIYLDNSCDSSCEENIANIKTIRLLTNDDMQRIQRVAIIRDNSRPSVIDKELIFANIVSEDLQQKLQNYPQKSIFLSDPFGNIIIYYNTQDLDLSKVVSDLSRLLKYSRTG